MTPIPYYSLLKKFGKNVKWSEDTIQRWKKSFERSGIYKDEAYTEAVLLQLAILLRSQDKRELIENVERLDREFNEFINAAQPMPTFGRLDEGVKPYMISKSASRKYKRENRYHAAQQKLLEHLEHLIPHNDAMATDPQTVEITNSTAAEKETLQIPVPSDIASVRPTVPESEISQEEPNGSAYISASADIPLIQHCATPETDLFQETLFDQAPLLGPANLVSVPLTTTASEMTQISSNDLANHYLTPAPTEFYASSEGPVAVETPAHPLPLHNAAYIHPIAIEPLHGSPTVSECTEPYPQFPNHPDTMADTILEETPIGYEPRVIAEETFPHVTTPALPAGINSEIYAGPSNNMDDNGNIYEVSPDGKVFVHASDGKTYMYDQNDPNTYILVVDGSGNFSFYIQNG
ncbi:hypothetical protein BC936DRAFT_138443 [Jimgerdemannia flammicorona]|uniref:Uncharacterized protein n=1 Tax=Jimgerdemannia flammicorona TaxID=994334 RepID=A0A433CFN0_9FUNG|nr:hypothetical protein BC936DRAFT_138443 [Jimgerdemannia flammicorona]